MLKGSMQFVSVHVVLARMAISLRHYASKLKFVSVHVLNNSSEVKIVSEGMDI